MPRLKKEKEDKTLTIAELQQRGYDIPLASVQAVNEALKVHKEINEKFQKFLRPRLLETLEYLQKSVDFKSLAIQADKINSMKEMFKKEYESLNVPIQKIDISPITHVPAREVRQCQHSEEYIIEEVVHRLYEKLKTSSNQFILYFTQDGQLYAHEDAVDTIKWNPKTQAYRIFKVLLRKRSGYVTTVEITQKAHLPSNEATWDCIKKMKRKVAHLNLPRPLIDSDKGSGYRIDPSYQVIEKKI